MNGKVSDDGETGVRLQAWRESLRTHCRPVPGRLPGQTHREGWLRGCGTARCDQGSSCNRWARTEAGGVPHPPGPRACSHRVHKPAMALATAMEMKDNQMHRSRASINAATAFWGAADLFHTPHPPRSIRQSWKNAIHIHEGQPLPIPAPLSPPAQGRAGRKMCPARGELPAESLLTKEAQNHGLGEAAGMTGASKSCSSPSRQHCAAKNTQGEQNNIHKKKQPTRVFSDKSKQIDL